ncbi:MAG: ABC transporter ATP-binding protein [Deinococcales bacterium]
MYLECRGISKTYGGTVRALQDVDLTVTRGHVHAIIGENGAGKSTLAKILGGLVQRDGGSISFKDQDYRPLSPRDADALGIGMVHQHFTLFPSLTVAENVILGREPTAGGRLDMARAVREVSDLASEYGMPVDPRRRVRELSVGERQRVEILKALYRDVELLILDEPTAVLTPQEVEGLFRGVQKLIAERYTVILIGHKLEEVLAVADEITVLRRGRVVGTHRKQDATKEQLVKMMVGTDLAIDRQRAYGMPGDDVLEIVRLSVTGDRGRPLLEDISLSVRDREIVGVAGVEGNGQVELERVLCGLVVPTSGRVTLGGVDVTRVGPRRRRDLGLSYVPADRMQWGCAPAASVLDNAISHTYRHHGGLGMLGRAALRRGVERMFGRFDVRAPNLLAPISALSGGNIQKLILGRELDIGEGGPPQAILVFNPTRGIDIRGVEYIHDLLVSYRDSGCAILLVSTDLDEIIALSDRIAVLFAGRVVAVLPGRGQSTKEQLGSFMLQGNAENVGAS